MAKKKTAVKKKVDQMRPYPIRRLSEKEIDDLAREQAEGKLAVQSRPGPSISRVVFVDPKGYPRITVSGQDGRLKDKRLHVLIAEAMLGRELLPNEEVHHRNGDKLDFHWENLVITHTEDHGAVSNKQKYYFKILGIKVEKLREREPGEDDDDY